MPDVKIFLPSEFVPELGQLLWRHVPVLVADQMSCTVDGEYYSLAPQTEIDLFVIWVDAPPHIRSRHSDVQLSSISKVIIEVAAYDFDDRMANITDRLKNIASGIKELLDLGEDEDVSITFFPVRQDCWAKV